MHDDHFDENHTYVKEIAISLMKYIIYRNKYTHTLDFFEKNILHHLHNYIHVLFDEILEK